MLRLDGIQAGYDGTQVLWDVTLSAERGAMTVLIGPNGAGKSTTLKVVNGLVRPTRGHVSFQGEDITRTPAHERPGRGIAACPEGRRLLPLLTTEGNLRLGAYSKAARSSADETLAYVYDLFPRLRERASVKAGRLSGGEQQMVGIGRALMSKPSILVLDEPSLGLAPKLVSEIFEKIHELRQGGLTVLMVEQNAYAALRIADFGYVMQNGRVVRAGPPAELLDLEALRRDYFAIGGRHQASPAKFIPATEIPPRRSWRHGSAEPRPPRPRDVLPARLPETFITGHLLPLVSDVRSAPLDYRLGSRGHCE